jgi:hypothetical protein
MIRSAIHAMWRAKVESPRKEAETRSLASLVNY